MRAFRVPEQPEACQISVNSSTPTGPITMVLVLVIMYHSCVRTSVPYQQWQLATGLVMIWGNWQLIHNWTAVQFSPVASLLPVLQLDFKTLHPWFNGPDGQLQSLSILSSSEFPSIARATHDKQYFVPSDSYHVQISKWHIADSANRWGQMGGWRDAGGLED